MAKIKARGAHEVARWVRERETPTSDLTAWERDELLLRSDGVLLRKDTVRWRADGTTHAGTWKRYARVKAGATPESLGEALAQKGYVKKGGA